MILTVDNKSHTLVQVTDDSTGTVIGLYLVPEETSIDDFEKSIQSAENQDDFDENNSLGVLRVYAYDSILTLNY